jgi:chromosome segregation ATPase
LFDKLRGTLGVAGLLKWSPWILVGATGIVSYVLFLNLQIANLQTQNTNLSTQVEQVSAANNKNLETIRSLENSITEQSSRTNRLRRALNAAETDRDRAVQMLRSHNLLELGRARPALLEISINQGTQDALNELQRETQEFANEMESTARRPE